MILIAIKPQNRPSTRRIPDVVVFDERAKPSIQSVGRGKKGFMSSKINKVIESPNPAQAGQTLTMKWTAGGGIYTRNDKLLHELVHSQLLNNTQAFDPSRGSAKRSRVVAGRLAELADNAKVGQGALSLVAKEQARHATGEDRVKRKGQAARGQGFGRSQNSWKLPSYNKAKL
ncbi:hypothetical protein RhiJN_19105 [Ceratobasidium sp. AG-Ba]|nr:hypothetical protein RhiJN_19105 [Ceratobasidium sp. AG-Ba]